MELISKLGVRMPLQSSKQDEGTEKLHLETETLGFQIDTFELSRTQH